MRVLLALAIVSVASSSPLVPSIVCPDGQSQCPTGNTCCTLPSGEWGCCPLPNAVCCSDHLHCCPNGYTCDVSTDTCTQGDISIPFFAKIPAKPKSVICPDEKSECPTGNTCCKLPSGEWGCCPLPKAVCCSDHEHCCPEGYTCDVSSNTCTQGDITIPFFAKVPAKAKSVVCPDGGLCPDGNTCCQLTSGQYGCCPYSNAVCCSDHEHCCPEGTTCDLSAGTCDSGDISIPFLAKIPAKPKDVPCPGGTSSCPDGNTCCQLASGQYGCCPLPNAVCCSDHLHCCPEGTTCDLSAGTCDSGDISIPFLAKIPAKPKNVPCPDGTSYCPDGNTCCQLPSGEWGCCPLPNAVCCSDHEHCCPNGYTCDVSTDTCTQGDISIPFLAKVPAKTKDVYCGGGYYCPDGNTCCRLITGDWGCCPYPSADCCSDGLHCCPSGYTCIVSTCTGGDVTVPFLTKVPAKLKSVICPDGKSECPTGNTCCQLSSGEWGCCPYSNAVCCSDHLHCCPNGTTCDLSAGTCDSGDISIPFLAKIPAKSRSVICPDGKSECPTGNTCCKLSSGEWGCCPLPNAVCCSDHEHCCPAGYTCDVSTDTCTQGDITIPFFAKVPAKSKTVVCPDGQSQCPDGNTCCQLSSGGYGCCPYFEAVCCSDHEHCCPEGTTCDVSEGKCNNGDISIPFLAKIPAKPKDVPCPGGTSYCPDGNTCCTLSSGDWGCCPLPNAVCCSDHKHCCPNGYTCDVSTDTCTQGDISIPFFAKIPAKPKTVTCRDGKSECPDGNTCCMLASGDYGCCPLENAQCCKDGKHCCPHGYTCDTSQGTCTKQSESIVPLFGMPPSLRDDRWL